MSLKSSIQQNDRMAPDCLAHLPSFSHFGGSSRQISRLQGQPTMMTTLKLCKPFKAPHHLLGYHSRCFRSSIARENSCSSPIGCLGC